jgi:hypothetical protein
MLSGNNGPHSPTNAFLQPLTHHGIHAEPLKSLHISQTTKKQPLAVTLREAPYPRFLSSG